MWESEDKQHTPNIYASIMRLRETRRLNIYQLAADPSTRVEKHIPTAVRSI